MATTAAYPSNPSKMNISNLSIDTVLSTGSFGITVYKSRLKETIINYAVKRIQRSVYESSPELARGVRHLRTLSATPHSFILQMLAVQSSENHVWVVMEYCAGGSLLHLLMSETTLTLSTCKSIMCEVTMALDHLHKQELVHCAVRPAAVLLTENGTAKLSSFAHARSFGAAPLTPPIPFPAYASPEMLALAPAAPCMDLWSLGCLGHEMLSGLPPYAGTTLFDVSMSVAHDDVLALKVSDEFDALIQGLLCKDAASRLTMDRLLEHPLLERVDHPIRKSFSSISIGALAVVGEQDEVLSQVQEGDEDASEIGF